MKEAYEMISQLWAPCKNGELATRFLSATRSEAMRGFAMNQAVNMPCPVCGFLVCIKESRCAAEAPAKIWKKFYRQGWRLVKCDLTIQFEA